MRKLSPQDRVLSEKLGITPDELDNRRASILREFIDRMFDNPVFEGIKTPETYDELLELLHKLGVKQGE